MKTDKRGYIFLGANFANQEFEPVPQKDGSLVLKPIVTVKVSKKDAWFFTKSWQDGERAVERHLAENQITPGVSAEQLIAQMKSTRSKSSK